MKPVKNILSKLKKVNNVLQPLNEVPSIKNNETVLIYDLTSISSNVTNTIVLPITGASYIISYNNIKINKPEGNSFPEITLNGGKNIQ